MKLFIFYRGLLERGKEGEIRKGLFEGVDYIVVRREVYDVFISWYGIDFEVTLQLPTQIPNNEKQEI